MNEKIFLKAAAITILSILFVILVAAAIFKNQPEDTLPNSVSDPENISENSVSESLFTERGWVINRLGYSYLYYDRALQQFNGTANTARRYAEAVNAITAETDAIDYFSIIVPTQTEFLDIPVSVMAEDNFYCNSQREAIYASSITMGETENINIYDILLSRCDEYLYFRTDYNWTALGAYYAYVAFCDAVDISPKSLDEYEAVELEGYLGWFYTATKSQMLLDNADTIVYYRIENEYPCYITTEENGYRTHTLKYRGTSLSADDGYSVFIGDEKPYYKFETRAKGPAIAIIGDTSAHAFIPFLFPHYSEIVFYNLAFVDETDAEIDINADTVLFMAYATNANSSYYCENLERLLNNE